MTELSATECFLLGWLSQADSSALGECKGRDLDRLVDLGLATIVAAAPGKHPDFGRVYLTEAGEVAAKNGGAL